MRRRSVVIRRQTTWKYYVEEDCGVELNVTLELRRASRDLSASEKVRWGIFRHRMPGVAEQGS